MFQPYESVFELTSSEGKSLVFYGNGSKEKVTQDEIREESRNLIIEGQVQVLALCLNKMRWH